MPRPRASGQEKEDFPGDLAMSRADESSQALLRQSVSGFMQFMHFMRPVMAMILSTFRGLLALSMIDFPSLA